jgi:DNA-binding transcriptional LysR family regulator
MELRHLRYFVAVAEARSFTRAAREIHVAQPALSVQVRQLEAEVGVALLDRSRRAVALTDAGEVMLAEARRLLAQLEVAVRAVRRTGEGTLGRLAVGFVPSAANATLPGLLRSFRQSHPDVRVHLHELAPDALVRDVQAGRLDVGFLYGPFQNAGLEQQAVAREPFVAALPDGHPLSSGATVSVGALADEAFILPARHGLPGLNAQVLAICHAAGFVPRPAHDDVWLVQTIVALVASGSGVALVPASARALGRQGVTYRSLAEAHEPAELIAVWRRAGRSAATAAFATSLAAPAA